MIRSTTARLAFNVRALAFVCVLAPTTAFAQFFVPAPQVWTQATFPAFPSEGVEPWDLFGGALEPGDFNGDGIDDLAIGAWGERVFGYTSNGVVNVLYGSSVWGLTTLGSQTIYAAQSGVFVATPGGTFGRALASGDFDGDSYDDLAVGIVGVSAVEVFYGSPGGLSLTRTLWLSTHPDSINLPVPADGGFGAAVEALDVNGDGYDELAIGAPTSRGTGGPLDSEGAVYILPGSAIGLGLGADILDQLSIHNGDPDYFDHFGEALASGNFNGDSREDLVVGAPWRQVAGAWHGGSAWVFRGTAIGPDRLTYTFLRQEATSGANSPEPYDHFGSSFAVGDINHDGRDDLAVGVPGQSRPTKLGTVFDSGAVNLFYGTASGVSTTSAAYLDQASAGVGVLEEGDDFGTALVLGDLNGDRRAELVVGVPGENSGAGAYQRFLTGLSGVSYTGSTLVLQPGTGSSEAYDRFGSRLALGDFDGNGLLDLAVGVLQEDIGTITDAGQVHVRYSEWPQVVGP